jgi:hypothetical protein
MPRELTPWRERPKIENADEIHLRIINLHNHVKKLLQTDRRRVAVGLDGEHQHARACRKRRFPTLARGPRDGYD